MSTTLARPLGVVRERPMIAPAAPRPAHNPQAAAERTRILSDSGLLYSLYAMHSWIDAAVKPTDDGSGKLRSRSVFEALGCAVLYGVVDNDDEPPLLNEILGLSRLQLSRVISDQHGIASTQITIDGKRESGWTGLRLDAAAGQHTLEWLPPFTPMRMLMSTRHGRDMLAVHGEVDLDIDMQRHPDGKLAMSHVRVTPKRVTPKPPVERQLEFWSRELDKFQQLSPPKPPKPINRAERRRLARA